MAEKGPDAVAEVAVVVDDAVAVVAAVTASFVVVVVVGAVVVGAVVVDAVDVGSPGLDCTEFWITVSSDSSFSSNFAVRVEI